MANSTGKPTSSTQEDEEATSATEILAQLMQDIIDREEDIDDEDDIDDEVIDDEDYEVASLPLLQESQANQKQSREREEETEKNQPKRFKKQNMMKINIHDFSEETLRLIEVWYEAELDPQDIFGDNEVTRLFSRPIKKQLMSSDVDKDQCMLMLSKEQVKEKMLPFLEDSEDPVKGIDVSVYGPDGKVQQMEFKMWNGDKTPVLTSGWKQFVEDYGLSMTCDFVTVWMFRHIKTRKLCFAIHYVKFSLRD
ncbi:unnamed protein product [Arabidopsis thaliana]|uniref:TF-B3 domain-containing protein n=1 Tax=Arabidopsis thaliana TaxID=3702 RepID=A0A654FLT6_ARATH|nr:unnamed protein product [Arabidopsis thaliana]